MSIESVIKNRDSILTNFGKIALNIQFPQEFELYVNALELVEAGGKTLRYFIFPIMPSAIDEHRPEITNVKKTLGGIVSVSNSTFVPKQIDLRGSFGRKFKILVGEDFIDLAQSLISGDGGSIFDIRAKTGYGCCKILQDIVEQSKIVDPQGPRRLYYYNLALGNSYLVKPMKLHFSMTEETNNMIWNYNLQLTGLAQLDQTLNNFKSKTVQLTIDSYVQKQANRLISNLAKIVTQNDTLNNKTTNATRL